MRTSVGWCVGVAIATTALVGCSSSSSTSSASTTAASGASTAKPDAAEKLRRLNVLAPVLTGFAPTATAAQADQFTCYLDAGSDSAMLSSAATGAAGNTTVVGRDVLIGMIACPESEWTQIPAAIVKAKVPTTEAAVQAVVAQGQAALDAG